MIPVSGAAVKRADAPRHEPQNPVTSLAPGIPMAPASKPSLKDRAVSGAKAVGGILRRMAGTPEGAGALISVAGGIANAPLQRYGEASVGPDWRVNDPLGRLNQDTVNLITLNHANNVRGYPNLDMEHMPGDRWAIQRHRNGPIQDDMNNFLGNVYGPDNLPPDAPPPGLAPAGSVPPIAHARMEKLLGARSVQGVHEDVLNAEMNRYIAQQNAPKSPIGTPPTRIPDPSSGMGYYANLEAGVDPANTALSPYHVHAPVAPIPGAPAASTIQRTARLDDGQLIAHHDIHWDGNLHALMHEMGHVTGSQALRDPTTLVGALKSVAEAENPASLYPQTLSAAIRGAGGVVRGTTDPKSDMTTAQRLGLAVPAVGLSAIAAAPGLLTLAEETRANLRGYQFAKGLKEPGARSTFLKSVLPGYAGYAMGAVPAAIGTAMLGKAVVDTVKKHLTDRAAAREAAQRVPGARASEDVTV
jgi:hypothetical protein